MTGNLAKIIREQNLPPRQEATKIKQSYIIQQRNIQEYRNNNDLELLILITNIIGMISLIIYIIGFSNESR
jgi:hypothetical protein